MKTLIILLFLVAAGYAIYRAYNASQEEAKEARTIRSLPPSVQHVVGQMDPNSQAVFFNDYERKKLKKSIGWILWFLFGLHYIYAKKVGMQFAYWFTLGGLGFWAIADLFRMPSIIRDANEQIAREVMQTLQMGASFRGWNPQTQPAQDWQSQPPPQQAREPSTPVPPAYSGPATPAEPTAGQPQGVPEWHSRVPPRRPQVRRRSRKRQGNHRRSPRPGGARVGS